MPRIYLSPSLQEYNPFYGGGSEEEAMNLIADAMEPYLAADGIEYLRNAPEMTLGQAIADSNHSNVDFHLAIHSNAAPPSVAGTRRGPVVYYYATSPYGRQMAELIAAGRAAVNHRECTKVDKTVEKGDVITCRGLGKCVVKDVPGQSRKGRTMVVMERYI